MENLQLKIFDIFLIFAPKHRLWVLTEAVLTSTHNLCFGGGGGSNEYPQSMFWSKNKKNRYTYIKVGFEGVYFTRTCFPDGLCVSRNEDHSAECSHFQKFSHFY